MKTFLQHHPVLMYFILVLSISYGSFLILVGPTLLKGRTEPSAIAEFVLFPIIDLGVLMTALVLTSILDGGKGLRNIVVRLGRWRVNVLWYAVTILLPPVLILLVLAIFRTVISPVFTPKFFTLGIVFGLPALLEEIGWTGYVYPRMLAKQSALSAAIVLGVLWGLWHGPVVDYLGAATPHGTYLLPFFLSFIAIVTAMRILIVWVYSHTESILLAWLMHLSMTASLVVFGPASVSPAQETLWYLGYAGELWMVVAVVALFFGKNLVRRPEIQTQLRETAPK